MKTTTSFAKMAKLKAEIRILQGGMRASKTYSILQLLIIIAEKSEAHLIISIVAESMPVLKKGAMRDFFLILEDEGTYVKERHNRTDSIYKIGNSTFEFFSIDTMGKAKGSQRDILFMNEANNVSYEIFDQLESRTKRFTFIDYNPDFEFWAHEIVMKQDNVERLILTYKDNEFLDKKIVKGIERRKPVYDKNGTLLSGIPEWWRVYGEGHTGRLEGVIFNNWTIVEKFPENIEFVCYGKDFGFTNDPTTLIEISRDAHGIYLNELIYKTGLTNSDIIEQYESFQIDKNADIFADSAEPKSIEEINRAGYNIYPAKKGADSIKYGIDLMKQQPIYVTERSLNLIKEFRRYSWKEDKNGKTLNVPIDAWNHGMDAVRYGLMSSPKFIIKEIDIMEELGMMDTRRTNQFCNF